MKTIFFTSVLKTRSEELLLQFFVGKTLDIESNFGFGFLIWNFTVPLFIREQFQDISTKPLVSDFKKEQIFLFLYSEQKATRFDPI